MIYYTSSVAIVLFQTLEAEMKKLQTSIMDATQGFDETLTKLFERKVKSEMVIYQVRQHTHTHTDQDLIKEIYSTFHVPLLFSCSFVGRAEDYKSSSFHSDRGGGSQ